MNSHSPNNTRALLNDLLKNRFPAPGSAVPVDPSIPMTPVSSRSPTPGDASSADQETTQFVANVESQINFQLLAAVTSGNMEEANKLLSSGKCDLNEVFGPLRVTLLHMASFLNPDLVPRLIARGANVRAVDKLGRTALHLACTAGDEACVAALIRAGAVVNMQAQVQRPEHPGRVAVPKPETMTKADAKRRLRNLQALNTRAPPVDPNLFKGVGKELPVPECWGRTPLHQAVKAGHPECVRLLLEAGARVEIRDERGLVPLLLAGAGVTSEDKFAVDRYEAIVYLLVDAGADVNVLNPDTGSSALHHAASRSSVAATQLLVKHGADVTRRGATGDTPLHEAAHCGCTQVLEILLDAVGGTDMVNKPNHVGCTPLHKAAFSGARECLALLLRLGGDMAALSHSNTTVLDAIFMCIARPGHFLASILDDCVQTNNVAATDRAFKVHLNFSVFIPNSSQQQTRVMRGLLAAPHGPGHSVLLRHPILETFLRLKWQRLRIFFYVFLVIYTCYLISLSLFVGVVHYNKKDYPAYNQSRSITQHVLTVTSSFLLGHVLLQAILLPSYYIKDVETWMMIICGSLSLVIARYNDETQLPHWVAHITSIDLVLAWTEMMLLIGRFPKWGSYALMFYTVLQNVLKVMVTFLCLVLGFTLSFFVQFDSYPMFSDPWKAFVKTMVMLTGEFEYQDIFNSSSNSNMLTNEPHRLPGTSRAIFLIFVVVASIVMMNLMVGLAVSDIQGIITEGHFKRLLKQADFVDHLESIITNKVLNKLLPECILRLLLKRRCIDTTITIQPSAVERKHRRPRNLPYRLLEACVELAVRKRAINKLKSDEELWNEYTFTGRRISWYMDEDKQSNNNLTSPGNMPLDIQELLVRITMDLNVIKEKLNAARPGTSDSNKLNIPRQTSKFDDVVSEMQGAQVMLRKLQGRSSRPIDWL